VTLEQRVCRIIAEQLKLPASEISMTSDLAGDLSIDSLDGAQILNTVEEEFGIDVADRMERFRTVGDIVRALEESGADRKS